MSDLDALLADAESAAALAQALITTGTYALNDKSLALDTLNELPPSPPFVEALKALLDAPGEGFAGLEQARLARAFELTGNTKRAAKSLRLALSAPGSPSLSVVLALAEGAVAGGDEALAVGLLDWIAVRLGKRDDRRSDRGRLDPVRDDPYVMGAFVERTGQASSELGRAARAVALLRTAAGRYERLGHAQDARRAQEAAALALKHVGKNDLATDFAMRLRVTAKEQKLPLQEARALALVAELMSTSTDSADQRKAASCWKEAAKILTEAGDDAGATKQMLALARMQALSAPDQAATTLEGAILSAHEHGLPSLQLIELELVAGQLDFERGKLGAALGAAERARKEAKEEGSEERQRAILLAARALVCAGGASLARKALAKCEPGLEAHALAGLSLHVRGELALVEGHMAEAQALLGEAARMQSRAADPQGAAASHLRRGELLLEDGDADGARAELESARALPLERRLSLWAEILETLLCDDPDEQEILFEEFSERAELEGGPGHRLLIATPMIECQLRIGDEMGAQATLTSAVDLLITIRDELPKPLRKNFGRSPLCRRLLTLEANELLAPELKRLTG